MHASLLTATLSESKEQPRVGALQSKYRGFVAWERPRYNLKTHPQVFGRS